MVQYEVGCTVHVLLDDHNTTFPYEIIKITGDEVRLKEPEGTQTLAGRLLSEAPEDISGILANGDHERLSAIQSLRRVRPNAGIPAENFEVSGVLMFGSDANGIFDYLAESGKSPEYIGSTEEEVKRLKELYDRVMELKGKETEAGLLNNPNY